ncbi:MAG TPA: AIR synthase related protein, partial [Nitrospirota bacterium]|nr:AIR synthase related protein [Nitrospirota bacterium]
DHMVRTDTVVGPGSDSAVIRIKGTNKGIAMTADCNSRYCFSDPYAGGAIAVAEAARNIVCAGGEPVGLTDCLNFGNPEKPEIMWQFQQAIEGISAVCRKFNIPVISGNVSFYNETNDISIYPTPVIGMAGIIEDISRSMTQYFKKEGDIVILLGNNIEELGMSEYLREIHYKVRGVPPYLDLDLEKKVQELCLYGIKQGIIKSAHDTSEGGLAVALAGCCMQSEDKKNIGAEIELKDEIRVDALLFGETQSRIIITVSPERVKEFEDVAVSMGTPVTVIGKVGGENLVIRHGSAAVIDMSVDLMADVWRKAIPGYLGEE